MYVAGHVFASSRAHAVLEPELRTVACDPGLALRTVDDVRHRVLELRACAVDEQPLRQPWQIDVTIGRNHFVLHVAVPPEMIASACHTASGPTQSNELSVAITSAR